MNRSLREKLQESLGIGEAELNRLILRAPNTYKVYEIPKKNGGTRIIAQPARETKILQYWLIENIFQNLPIHECATAYKIGCNIKQNAYLHKDNSYIVKFDFKNFFNSIKGSDLRAHLSSHLSLNLSDEEIDDIDDIIKISCIHFKNQHGLCLSIGAPSSPLLSNSVMFEFDTKIFEWCKNNSVIYTRYADDITFSTNTKGVSSNIEPMIKEVMEQIAYPSLSLNTTKTTHLSRKYQRRITGVIINNEGNISLGRKRKREISTLIHRFSLGLLLETEIYRLQGLLSFANDIEPLFLNSMESKYSSTLISEILKKHKINTAEKI